jgi:hypothetical protein
MGPRAANALTAQGQKVAKPLRPSTIFLLLPSNTSMLLLFVVILNLFS